MFSEIFLTSFQRARKIIYYNMYGQQNQILLLCSHALYMFYDNNLFKVYYPKNTSIIDQLSNQEFSFNQSDYSS